MNPSSCVTGNAGRKVSSISMVEENGELHTNNICKGRFNLRQDEKKETRANGKQKRRVAEERSRGKLATGLGAQGFKHKIMEFYAAKKIYAKNLLKEVAEAMRLGEEFHNETPHKEEWAVLQKKQEQATARNDGTESDQGGSGGRLVGADEE